MPQNCSPYADRLVQSPTWRPTADLRIRVISVDFFGAPSARRPNNTVVSKSTNRRKDHTYVLDGPRSIDSTRQPAAFITMTTYLSCCPPSEDALFCESL